MGKEITALEVYLVNQDEAKKYIMQFGDDPVLKNKAVTLSYNHLAENDPLFIWFAAAVAGSDQVGKTIAFIENPVLNNCQSAQTVALGFSWGNQKIHNNIVGLYNTYLDLGIAGLEQLYKQDINQSYISDNALAAFKIFDGFKNQASEFSKKNNLPPNHPDAIAYILNNPENLQQLKKASVMLVMHEQDVVAPMYELAIFENYKTVGEVINDVSFAEMLVANGLKISGAQITDKYIPLTDYDFNDYSDRVSYFEKVFEVYFDILANPNGFKSLSEQRDNIIEFHIGEKISIIADDALDKIKIHHDGDAVSAIHPKDINLAINMANTNLGLICQTKDDIRNSPDYIKAYSKGLIYYKNANLPWLETYSAFVEAPDGKFYYITLNGINRGLVFPLLYDKNTDLPLGVPLNEKHTFIEKNSLDVLINNPQLFNDPGHISNNTALQHAVMHHATIGLSSITINNTFNQISNKLFHDLIDPNNGFGSDINKHLADVNSKNVNNTISVSTHSTTNSSSAAGNTHSHNEMCVSCDDMIKVPSYIDTDGTLMKVTCTMCFPLVHEYG